MPWKNDPQSRRRSDLAYGSAEYQENRAKAVKRAGGRCKQCGHRHRLECDHIIPRSRSGTDQLENLQMLCAGEGTCKCHEKKTAGEGGGYRSVARDPAPVQRTKW